jgi:hypothetical protein
LLVISDASIVSIERRYDVRLVSCGVRESKQALIDRERERERSEKRKEDKSITEYVRLGDLIVSEGAAVATSPPYHVFRSSLCRDGVACVEYL